MASNPYLGDVALYAFNFTPVGWQICDGSQLSIAENEALFNLIGTTYGGDGVTTFAVPDLRGRTPLGVGNNGGTAGNVQLGEMGGTEQVTLTLNNLPAHSHVLSATAAIASSDSPANAVFADTAGPKQYGTAVTPPVVTSKANTLLPTGGATPVNLREPYVGMNWCIALQGIYPQLH
jgi:microcystin-dependent protein